MILQIIKAGARPACSFEKLADLMDPIDLLLKESLEEESAALEEFTEIAETSVNLARVCA